MKVVSEALTKKVEEKEEIPVAGYICFWDTPKVRIVWQEVEEKKKEFGLVDMGLYRGSGREFIEGVLIRIKKDVEDVVWRVQRKFDEGSKRTYWTFFVGRVRVKEELKILPAKIIVFEDREFILDGFPEGLEVKIKKIAEELRNSDDASHVSWQVVKYLLEKLYAIRVRADGGFYFVKQKYQGSLERILGFLRSLGFYTHSLAVVDDIGIREVIWMVLENETKRMEQEIKEYLRDLEEGMRFNKSGFETRFETVKHFLTKLKLYRDISAKNTLELESLVDALQEKLLEVKLQFAIEGDKV